MSQHSPSSTSTRPPRSPPSEPRPSASIVLLSRTNRVLLLRRVSSSSAFASASVFPGGNLSGGFHEKGLVPLPESAERHKDGEGYRLAAVRETFEESGILLARRKGGEGKSGQVLLALSEEIRDEGRKLVHGNKVRFTEWLESVGGVPDTENLIPFTRWITPASSPRRFTTQMYLYLLPLSPSSPPPSAATPAGEATADEEDTALVPTPDGGIEHTAAIFDSASAWLRRAGTGKDSDVLLFPPQAFLLNLLARFCPTPPEFAGSPASASSVAPEFYGAQRRALLEFLAKTPTDASGKPEAQVSWADKVISPVVLGAKTKRADGRVVLALHSPRGDWEHVALVKFTKAGASEVEIRMRKDILNEARDSNDVSKL